MKNRTSILNVDPSAYALTTDDLDALNGGTVNDRTALLATLLTNLANMRHEMLKSIANNLRG